MALPESPIRRFSILLVEENVAWTYYLFCLCSSISTKNMHFLVPLSPYRKTGLHSTIIKTLYYVAVTKSYRKLEYFFYMQYAVMLNVRAKVQYWLEASQQSTEWHCYAASLRQSQWIWGTFLCHAGNVNKNVRCTKNKMARGSEWWPQSSENSWRSLKQDVGKGASLWSLYILDYPCPRQCVEYLLSRLADLPKHKIDMHKKKRQIAENFLRECLNPGIPTPVDAPR